MSFFERPTVLYPTVVSGRITGPIRCESLDGSEMWLPAGCFGIYYDSNIKQMVKIISKDGIARLNNFGPFEMDGKTWCISHLQKKATYFSLLYDPFIYHFGKFWKLQDYTEDANGSVHWKPGTERGIYFRTPGWRWQVPDAISDWTPWILSGGRIPGGHLD